MAGFKGFMGSEPSPHEGAPEDMERNFEDGAAALTAQRPAEAYLYFSKSDQEHSAVLYNTALCFYTAGLYERALPLLDKALRCLPVLADRTASLPQELELFEAQGGGYKNAMLLSAPKQFPERCRVSILRLKADVLLAAGRKEELRSLLPALLGKHYKNIEEIAEILRNEV